MACMRQVDPLLRGHVYTPLLLLCGMGERGQRRLLLSAALEVSFLCITMLCTSAGLTVRLAI